MAKEVRLRYENYVKKAPLDPNYPSGQKRRYLETEDQLDALIKAVEKQRFPAVGLDTETNNLSIDHGGLVGVSIAFTRTESVYLPVAHRIGNNLPLKKVIKLVALVFKNSGKVCFWNFRFDIRFLMMSGLKEYLNEIRFDLNYFDSSILAYNADTNIPMRDLNLKIAILHHRGWPLKTFKDTTGEKEDFSYNHPSECYEYACDDALATLEMTYKLSWVYKECQFICNLDNAVLIPMLRMEDTPTKLNKTLLEEMRETITSSMAELEAKVYGLVGYSFKINSPQQLVKALDYLGLKTKKTTKKGASSTDEEALEGIVDQHEVVPFIIEYKKLLKLRSSYVESLLRSFRPDLGGCRFSYAIIAVPTGRLAAMGGGRNKKKQNLYFGFINVQSTPKSHGTYYRAVKDGGPILGWSFIPDEKGEYEGFVQKNNVRTAFMAPEGYLWVSLDYSGQELRIPANLSKEPIWVNTFVSGGDLHTEMAVQVYGERGRGDRDLRKKVKELNFGALYGGSRFTFARKLKCSLEEAQELLDTWWRKLRTLKNWTNAISRLAKKQGFLYSIFGRPRRLKHWYSSSNWKDRRFADRTAVNTQVQGAAGDMMRIDLVQFEKKMKEYYDSKELYLVSSIHDEVNFYVKEEKFDEIVSKLIQIMMIKIPGWQVPMDVGVEVGTSWGYTFKFQRTESGEWVPKKG